MPFEQPPDVTHIQDQTTAPYVQTTYATSYGQTLLGCAGALSAHPCTRRVSLSPQVCCPPVQGPGTGTCDATRATVTTPPPRGPLMQLSLRMALSLLTQPMGNSWQPRGLQDCRMVANPLRQINLNPARRVNKEPSLPQVPGSYLMMPVPSPPSYPPTS